MFVSRVRTFGVIGGWFAFALIAIATLSPIEDRPSLAGPKLEHFTAFALMGLAFVLGYRRRTLLIVTVVIGSAFVLEATQLLTADRHGRLLDAVVKAFGGLCGIGAGQLFLIVLRNQLRRLKSAAEHSTS